MFLHFYGLSDSRLQWLREHYENHGVSLRTHGNTKRLPHNTLSQATIEVVKAYFVEENAISLPGFKSDEIKVLSLSKTKRVCGEFMKQLVKLRMCKQLGTQTT